MLLNSMSASPLVMSQRCRGRPSRSLLYAGWLQRIVGRAGEAEELLRRAVREAKALSMPYETALMYARAWDAPLLTPAARGVLQGSGRDGAIAEAAFARSEIAKLPGGFREPKKGGGGGAEGEKSMRAPKRSSLGMLRSKRSSVQTGGAVASSTSASRRQGTRPEIWRRGYLPCDEADQPREEQPERR